MFCVYYLYERQKSTLFILPVFVILVQHCSRFLFLKWYQITYSALWNYDVLCVQIINQINCLHWQAFSSCQLCHSPEYYLIPKESQCHNYVQAQYLKIITEACERYVNESSLFC